MSSGIVTLLVVAPVAQFGRSVSLRRFFGQEQDLNSGGSLTFLGHPLNMGATSEGLNPASPQPIGVTQKVSWGWAWAWRMNVAISRSTWPSVTGG